MRGLGGPPAERDLRRQIEQTAGCLKQEKKLKVK